MNLGGDFITAITCSPLPLWERVPDRAGEGCAIKPPSSAFGKTPSLRSPPPAGEGTAFLINKHRLRCIRQAKPLRINSLHKIQTTGRRCNRTLRSIFYL